MLKTVAAHRPLRVLVVDDHADGAEMLAMLLRLEGHEVQVVLDGQAALERCRVCPPELVLLDIQLSGDLDGYEVARRLRRGPTGATACLVAVTGHGTQEDRRRASEAGFDILLLKPVDPAELRELAGVVGST